MKEELINEVQRRMLPYLNNEQLLRLKDALDAALCGNFIINAAYSAASSASAMKELAISKALVRLLANVICDLYRSAFSFASKVFTVSRSLCRVESI